MKVRLNKLPVKTTNGFKINDVELELEIPNYKRKKDVLIEGDMSSLKIEKTFTKKTSTSRIGLEVLEYEELTIQVPKGIHVKVFMRKTLLAILSLRLEQKMIRLVLATS